MKGTDMGEENELAGRDDLMVEHVPTYKVVDLSDGRKVRIVSSSSRQRNELEYKTLDPVTCRPSREGLVLAKARNIQAHVVDAAGMKLFRNKDVEAITDWPVWVTDELDKAIDDHNGTDQSDIVGQAKN